MSDIGRNAVMQIDDKDGTPATVTPCLTSVNLNRSHDNPEVTAFGDREVQRISGLEDSTMDTDGNYDQDYIETFDAALGEQRSVDWNPGGTASGKATNTGEMIGQSLSIDIPFDGPVTFSASFEGTGAIALGDN